jgi:hypothetical protein
MRPPSGSLVCYREVRQRVKFRVRGGACEPHHSWRAPARAKRWVLRRRTRRPDPIPSPRKKLIG